MERVIERGRLEIAKKERWNESNSEKSVAKTYEQLFALSGDHRAGEARGICLIHLGTQDKPQNVVCVNTCEAEAFGS